MNGDGDLDVTSRTPTADGDGALLIGNGDGTFGAPTGSTPAGTRPSTDLGDLDGDGDLDWVLSSYGGGFWRST